MGITVLHCLYGIGAAALQRYERFYEKSPCSVLYIDRVGLYLVADLALERRRATSEMASEIPAQIGPLSPIFGQTSPKHGSFAATSGSLRFPLDRIGESMIPSMAGYR